MSISRLLVYSSFPPLPIDRGDKNRLFHVLNLLREIAEVRLIYLQRDWENPITDWSSLKGIQIQGIKIRKTEVVRKASLATLIFQPNIVFKFGLSRVIDLILRINASWRPQVFLGVGIASLPILQRLKGLRRILDLVDSPSIHCRMVKSSIDMDLISRIGAFIQWRLEYYERLAIDISDKVLINSERDKEYLCSMHGEKQNIHVLENCVPKKLMDNKWRLAPSRPENILFVGNMAYGPNKYGVLHFVKEIFPLISVRLPKAQFVICGKGSSKLLQRLGHPARVRAIEFANDLIGMYLSAAVAVVPVPLAGGAQYKLLEAMAIGVPIVASRQTAYAAGLMDGQELFVGDTDEGYATKVVSVIKNSNVAMQLSERGRLFISNNHVWEEKINLLRHILYQ